jgi:hypothetical protein
MAIDSGYAVNSSLWRADSTDISVSGVDRFHCVFFHLQPQWGRRLAFVAWFRAHDLQGGDLRVTDRMPHTETPSPRPAVLS